MFSYAHAQNTGGAQDPLLSLLPLILMFVVLYFLMIRPQMKRAKEHKALVDGLAKGDEIVTSGGILGKISKVEEQFILVEVSEGMELRFQKASVAAALPKGTLKNS